MCWAFIQGKNQNVHKIDNSEGEISNDTASENAVHVPVDLPEHVDNPLLNRDVKTGILGFRYENKLCTITVYSSIECKTFCWIMGYKPMKN